MVISLPFVSSSFHPNVPDPCWTDSMLWLLLSLLLPGCILSSSFPKRGVVVAPHKNHTFCGDLENLTNLTWWYDYSTWGASFNEGSCIPQNQEFVPCIWGKGVVIHDTVNTTLLAKAKYLMTWNEPDQYGQSWVHPYNASQLWPKITALAHKFNLSIVAPCVSNADGASWWLKSWAGNCTKMYGKMCEFDFACTHGYYFPTPCPKDVHDWACASHLMPMLKGLNARFGKPVWFTEFACRSWGRPSGIHCTNEENIKFASQVLPQLDSAPEVARYSWFISRDVAFPSDSLLAPLNATLTPLGKLYNRIT
eukprot:m.50697 g.50697  ORF g.50697 m.50697 type:complete len:308 (+) comp18068_c0_seq3:57-980(+)